MRSQRKIRPIRTMHRTFEGLCKVLALRPIHSTLELENATRVIDALAGHRLNQDQSDYLEALASLVAVYEEARYAKDLSHITPIEALRFLVEQNGLTASALGELLGSRSLGSKLLRGERDLSKEHISRLAERFRVSPALFIRAGKARKPAA